MSNATCRLSVAGGLRGRPPLARVRDGFGNPADTERPARVRDPVYGRLTSLPQRKQAPFAPLRPPRSPSDAAIPIEPPSLRRTRSHYLVA